MLLLTGRTGARTALHGDFTLPSCHQTEWIRCGLVPQVPPEGEPTLSKQRECTNSHAAQGLRAPLGGWKAVPAAAPCCRHQLPHFCVSWPAQQAAPALRPPKLRADLGPGAEHTTPTLGAVSLVNPALGCRGQGGRGQWSLGCWRSGLPARLHMLQPGRHHS